MKCVEWRKTAVEAHHGKWPRWAVRTALINEKSSNLPNLRRLFVEARTEAEESVYSRNAFYNLALFMSSVAVFSLIAQRMNGQK
ncbi:hypothetical protein D0859_04720 [Hortaea werneckii]|uniref:Uncharacterized protein n=1 Tax=Hortaea werneckii TaxID=91943 RepID=A0A3M7J0G0_HORWE|nr:hypothetical protein D0859_04720 [Hortaea werneckii]